MIARCPSCGEGYWGFVPAEDSGESADFMECTDCGHSEQIRDDR